VLEWAPAICIECSKRTEFRISNIFISRRGAVSVIVYKIILWSMRRDYTRETSASLCIYRYTKFPNVTFSQCDRRKRKTEEGVVEEVCTRIKYCVMVHLWLEGGGNKFSEIYNTRHGDLT